MGPQHANRLKFQKDYQNKFFLTLMKKLSISQRKLARKLDVSRSALRHWIKERLLLPEKIFYRCVKILPELSAYKNFIIDSYPKNWGRTKGGKIRSKMKTNLTQKLRIKGFRRANSKTVKRRIKGPNGELMYNEGERKIAELLLKHRLKYKYEPIIYLGNKYCFPDFLVKNYIIERCGYSDWSGYWNRITDKLQLCEKYFNGRVIIIVPDNRFSIAIKRLNSNLRNIIILKESTLEVLPNIIKGVRSSSDESHGEAWLEQLTRG